MVPLLSIMMMSEAGQPEEMYERRVWRSMALLRVKEMNRGVRAREIMGVLKGGGCILDVLSDSRRAG